jgi:hypothetical protein
MALGFGEQRLIAAIAGMWVTAFVLVAIIFPSGLMLAFLAAIAFIGGLWLQFRAHYKLLSAYAYGSAIVFAIGAAIRFGLLR